MNGLEAFDAVARGGVDLVLLDVEMPGMSELKVLTTLRILAPSAARHPAVLVSLTSQLEA